jgi:hypothetical protein
VKENQVLGQNFSARKSGGKILVKENQGGKV